MEELRTQVGASTVRTAGPDGGRYHTASSSMRMVVPGVAHWSGDEAAARQAHWAVVAALVPAELAANLAGERREVERAARARDGAAS